MTEQQKSAEELALEVKRLTEQLMAEGRKDLLLKAISVPLLEELRIEAAKGKLSKLLITEDYRFVLVDYNQEVELQPVHKAVYLLFLAHPEGIEFKKLSEYREELNSRGDRYLSHRSRYTQVPVPATTAGSDLVALLYNRCVILILGIIVIPVIVCKHSTPYMPHSSYFTNFPVQPYPSYF